MSAWEHAEKSHLTCTATRILVDLRQNCEIVESEDAYCNSPFSATKERKVELAIVLHSGQQASPWWQSCPLAKTCRLLISCVYVARNLLLDKRKEKPRSFLTRPGWLLFFCSRGLIWGSVDPTLTWTSDPGDGLASTLRKGLVDTWSYSLGVPAFRPLFLESLQNFESGHSSRTGETSDIPSWFQQFVDPSISFGLYSSIMVAMDKVTMLVHTSTKIPYFFIILC